MNKDGGANTYDNRGLNIQQGHSYNPAPVLQDDKELRQLISEAAQSFGKDPITKRTIWESYLIPEGFIAKLTPALIAWRDKAVVAAEAGLKSYVDKYPDMTLKEYWDGKHQKQAYKAATLTKEEGVL